MVSTDEKKKEEQNWYAMARWHADDIKQHAKMRFDLDITDEQAEEWLSMHESNIADRMVEMGWDVIDSLMSEEDFEDE